MSYLRLGDIRLTHGGSVNPEKNPDERFELYSIPAYDDGRPESVTGSEIGSSKNSVCPGDVLLSRIVPHIRRAWVVGARNGHRQIASGEWLIFRSARVYSRYLRWMLVSDPFHASFMQTVAGVGGSLLRARPTLVDDLQIPLPPLPEQKRIAAILDAADSLRVKRRESFNLLDDLVRSVFLEMFGDPVLNPRKWPVSEIGEVTDCLDRMRIPVKASERIAGDVPYYGANGQQGWIDKAIFDEPLVLVAEDGGHFDDPERGVAYRIDGPSWVNNHAHVLRATGVRTEYLHRLLRHFDFTPYLTGSTRAKLNQKRLNSVTIPVPPDSEQRRFEKVVDHVSAQAEYLSAHLTELDTLIASLQFRAFRGEL